MDTISRPSSSWKPFEVFVAIFMIAVVGSFAYWVFTEVRAMRQASLNRQAAIAASTIKASPEGATLYPYSSDSGLRTVAHDGHRFIVQVRYDAGFMLHHPDCACTKRAAAVEATR